MTDEENKISTESKKGPEERLLRTFKIDPKLKDHAGFQLWKYKLSSRLATMDLWDASAAKPVEHPIAKDSIVASLADEFVELVLDQHTTAAIWATLHP
jgi:hypothetical protein